MVVVLRNGATKSCCSWKRMMLLSSSSSSSSSSSASLLDGVVVRGGRGSRNHHNNHSRLAYHVSSLSSLSSSSSCRKSDMTMSCSWDAHRRRHCHCHCRSFSALAVDPTDHDKDTTATKTNRKNLTPFLLADIGEGIAEVELLQWFVQDGDVVQQFDRICEVQSDKATVEITSRYDGTVSQLQANVGDMIQVGTPLLYYQMTMSGDDESNHNEYETKSTTTAMEYDEQLHIPTIASQYHLQGDDDGDDDGSGSGNVSSSTSTTTPSSKVMTSPAIRKLAKEYQLDLGTIVGTGPKGRVLKGDVLTVLKERGLLSTTTTDDADTATTLSSSPTTTSTASATSPSPATTTTIVKSLDQVVWPLQENVTYDIRGYNRLMVQSMTQSLKIPHMVYSDEVDMTTWYRHYKASLSFLPLVIKATSLALHRYPLLNATLSDDETQITLLQHHHIGIAMDTPRGLVVPVIHHVQDKSISDIAQDLKRLKGVVQQQQLEGPTAASFAKEDLLGATFTLSNIGAIGAGGTYMSPIVTSPQVAIGAIGKMQRLPRFTSQDSMEVQEAHILTVSWGGDHRVVDGATMARFHSQWKTYLQDPIHLLKDMK